MMMNNKICAICGKAISGKVSDDHVFPRAIYKWSEEYLTTQEYQDLKKQIESADNHVSTHPDCNYQKEDEIPDINALHLSLSVYNGLISVEKTVNSAVVSYCDHKQQVLLSQAGRCAGCGCELQKGVLRRRDPDLPRRWENACIVCHECNLKNEKF